MHFKLKEKSLHFKAATTHEAQTSRSLRNEISIVVQTRNWGQHYAAIVQHYCGSLCFLRIVLIWDKEFSFVGCRERNELDSVSN